MNAERDLVKKAQQAELEELATKKEADQEFETFLTEVRQDPESVVAEVPRPNF